MKKSCFIFSILYSYNYKLWLSVKRLILILFMCSMGYNSFSSNDLFEESKDISCKDLPKSFKKYAEDRNLNQTSLVRSLEGTITFLRNHAKGQVSKIKVLRFIEELEDAVSLSRANQYTLISRADDISYAFSNCVRRSN